MLSACNLHAVKHAIFIQDLLFHDKQVIQCIAVAVINLSNCFEMLIALGSKVES